MKIRRLGTLNNGTVSYEIPAGVIGYRTLLRCIRNIPGALVKHSDHDLLNDNTNVTVIYKDITITIDTPFSDYIISCNSNCEVFDEFISYLKNYNVKWWEGFF